MTDASRHNAPSDPVGILIANGTVTAAEVGRLDLGRKVLVVAADGGALSALEHGISPDIVVGDFDSIGETDRDRFGDCEWLHRPEQDSNDLEKALIVCRERGIRRLTVLGATGGRLDHTLTNLSVLARYDCVFELTVLDRYGRLFLVRERWTHAGRPGQTISLMPLGRVEGVRTEGLRWELDDATLAVGEREGLSNVMEGDAVTISIRSGLLAVMVVRGDDPESSGS